MKAAAKEISLKSPEDPYVYRLITLRNGLQCLLIATDKEKEAAKQKRRGGFGSPEDSGSAITPAAVALTVHVGHFSDPDDIPGLAHFLEHMLFMGTKKYPDENEWEAWLTERGGFSNASTDSEVTVYQFDVQPPHLDAALDRFSQFFIAPLFKASSVKREIRAVHSEFKDSVNDDSMRMQELLYSTCARGHPFSKFGWGNLCSLETIPQEKGLNVRQHLLEFHRRYYFAEAMKLVILDPVKSLDELQRGAERCFTSIPTRAMQQAAGIERPLPRRAGNSSAKLVKATQHVGNGAVTKTGQAGKRQTTSTQTAVGVIPARWRWIIGTAGWNRAFAEAQQLALITHAAGPDFFQFGCPFEQADRCMAYIFRIVPVKVVKKLQLSWTLPPLDCLWRCKPVDWVEHVLGHEGAGSLLSALKLRGLATGLTAGASRTTSNCWMFSVTTYLTEKGVTEYAQVLELNFALLALLRSTFLLPHTRAELDALWGGASNLPVVAADAAEHVRKLWIEQQKLAEMRFRFQEQSEPIDYAEGLSEELLLQPDDRVLTASALFFDYDPELIRGIIALLTPDTARIDFMDSSFEPLANETEEWFGIRFSRTPVAAETLQRWWKPDVVLQKEMQLPALNAYIPEDFTLKGLAAGVVPVPAQVSKVDRVSSSTSQRPAKGKAKGKKGAAASKVLHPEDNVQLVEQYLPIVRFEMSPPAMVMDSQFGRLWHKLDTLFETPRATICVLFQSPVAYGTPARAAEHALFISLLSEALTELSYPAGLAQLHYSLSNHRFGTELRVSGFNDKLFVLARGILDRLVTYDVFHHGAASAESDPFVFCKERLIRALKNENASPLVYANSLRLLMLQCGIVMPEEFLRAAQKVTREDIVRFQREMYGRMFVEMLVHGNVLESEARQSFDEVQSRLKWKPLAVAERAEDRAIQLPQDKHVLVRVPVLQPQETNSGCQVYFQLGAASAPVDQDALLHYAKPINAAEPNPAGPPRSVAVQLLRQMMWEPFFDQLRTKEQLGYNVSTDVKVTAEVSGLVFALQAANHAPDYLEARVEAFLIRFREMLAKMSSGQYQNHVRGVLMGKLRPFTNLSEYTNAAWGEISTGSYIFDRVEREALDLLRVSHDSLLHFFDLYLLPVELSHNGSEEKRELAQNTDRASSVSPLFVMPPNLRRRKLVLSVFGVESVVGSSDAQAVPSDMGEEDSEATDSQGSASDDDYSDDSQTVAPYDPVESARLIASENRLLQRLLPRRNLFAYSDSKEPTRTLLEDEIGPLGVLNDDAAVVLTTQTAVVQLRRSLPSYPSFVSPSVLSSRF